jgi:hypothetical protein
LEKEYQLQAEMVNPYLEKLKNPKKNKWLIGFITVDLYCLCGGYLEMVGVNICEISKK